MTFLFFIILVLFPLGQVLRWQAPFSPEIRLQPFDLAIFIFVFVWALTKFRRREKLVLPFCGKELALFAALAVFSLLIRLPLPAADFLPAFFYLIRLLVFIIFYLAAVELLPKLKINLAKILLFEGVVVALLSLLQYLFVPDMRFLLQYGWDEHYFRAIGPFLDPAFTGIILTLGFLLLIFSGTVRDFKLKIALSLVLLLAIGLTFSRLTYLCLVIGTGVGFLFKKKTRFYPVFLLLLFCLIFLLPKPGGEGVNLWRTSSFIARLSNYCQTLEIIKKNFWFGVGFNRFRVEQKEFGFFGQQDWKTSNAGAGADNSFLFVWATTGVFGFLAYLFLWLKILGLSFSSRSRRPGALLVFISAVCLIISGLAVNSLFYPWIMFWFFCLLANFTAENAVSTQAEFCSPPGRGRQF